MDTDSSKVVFQALSLGAGVQSSVLALLLSREDERLVKLGYPRPDCAVFADTGWEPAYVYEHLDWLEEQLTFPLIRLSEGNLKTNVRKAQTVSGHTFVDVPFYTVNPEDRKKGMLRRQCTNHYKVRPIYREVRRRAGGQPGRPFPQGRHAEMWLGISTDEVLRMKPSREPWVKHRWPLVDIDFSRADCMDWFHDKYPNRRLPRSACVICPYRSDENWLELKQSEPESYKEAVRFDRWLRNSRKTPVRRILTGIPYLHSARRPLESVVAERESGSIDTLNHFNNECEGHCGV